MHHINSYINDYSNKDHTPLWTAMNFSLGSEEANTLDISAWFSSTFLIYVLFHTVGLVTGRASGI